MKQTPCFVTPATSCHVMWRHVTWCDVMLSVCYVTSDYSSERCSVLVCEVCTVAVHFINFQIDTSTLYILHYTTRTKVIPMTVKLYSKSVRHLLYYTVLESTQSKSSHRICTIEMIWNDEKRGNTQRVWSYWLIKEHVLISQLSHDPCIDWSDHVICTARHTC